MDAAWSPNGRWIAFSRIDARPGRQIRFQVFKVRPDGTGLRRLTRGLVDKSEPAWSPDGRHIAFTWGGLASTGALKVMRPDGSHVRTVLDLPGNESSPSWSPDGTRIVLWSSGDQLAPPDGDRPPHQGIWTVSPDGTDPAYVVRDGFMPDWQALPAKAGHAHPGGH